MSQHKDCCGTPLVVGDYVAYAVRTGNTAALKLARVIGFSPSRLKVVAAERDWSGSWRRQARVATLGTLSNVCRVLSVPDAVRSVLW